MKIKQNITIVMLSVFAIGNQAIAADKSSQRYSITNSGYTWEIRKNETKAFLIVSIGGSNPDPRGTQSLCGAIPATDPGNITCVKAFYLNTLGDETADSDGTVLFTEEELKRAESLISLAMSSSGSQGVIDGDSISNHLFDQIVDWSASQNIRPSAFWGLFAKMRKKARKDVDPVPPANTRSKVEIYDHKGRLLGDIRPGAGYETGVFIYPDHVDVFYRRADGSLGNSQRFYR